MEIFKDFFLGKICHLTSYLLFTVRSFFILLSILKNLSTNIHGSNWHHFSHRNDHNLVTSSEVRKEFSQQNFPLY